MAPRSDSVGTTWRLPRSALLAAWGTAALTGRASASQAQWACAGGEDLPVMQGALRCNVEQWLTQARGAGVQGLRCLLPVPGLALGLPGPANTNKWALAAGECVATINGPPVLLYPEVADSASQPAPRGHWQECPTAGPAVADFVDVRQSNRELQAAVRATTARMEELDVAQWPRELLLGPIVQLGEAAGHALPPGLDGSAIQLLELAARISAVTAVAVQSPGAALSSWEVTARHTALRELAIVARQAVAAAVNDPLRHQL